ncbi:hypothetical protein BGZ63DRAFT_205661 [Mariannaea sp. PMI_226]|nr:hypothetical protein BGZ63DRAFT_205661 [Mariannaea sp. PMI_226]
MNSPRSSVDANTRNRPISKPDSLSNGMHYSSAVPIALAINGNGAPHPDNTRVAQDLKLYLEDQNAVLVSEVQNLVSTVRGEANIRQIAAEIDSISAVVGKIIAEAESSGYGDMISQLSNCRARLLEAGDRGEDMANIGIGANATEWRQWTQTLPPIAFETAREAKEFIQRIDWVVNSGGVDEFS